MMPHWTLEEFHVAAPRIWQQIADKFHDVEDTGASVLQDDLEVVNPASAPSASPTASPTASSAALPVDSAGSDAAAARADRVQSLFF